MTRQRVLIIAEAGVNHNGCIELARSLVDVAADAGADVVKFQTFSADRLATQHAPKADYQLVSAKYEQSQFEMLRQLELSPKMHNELLAYCKTQGVCFLSTGFDIQSLDYLASLDIETFKIPSGEITNLPYLRHVGKFGKRVIISTGMATLGEIEAALNVLERAGTPRYKIIVLHCTSAYPASIQDVNLRAMQTIRDAFGVQVGYSDHTLGIEVPIAAVALGATVIEKHVTLDRTMPGPDHKASLEPSEFSAMVQAIRNIENALGDGIKRPVDAEVKNSDVVRKSLVASSSIRAGEIFSADNVCPKRPGVGLSPMLWDMVIGRVAKRDYSIDELIEL